MRKILVFILAISIMMTVPAFAGEVTPDEVASGNDAIPYWTDNSSAMQSIVSFVKSVEDESSDSYVPVEDRIAVFDFDGTLFGELFPTSFDTWLLLQLILHDDIVQVDDQTREDAAALEAALLAHEPEPENSISTSQLSAELFKGMTVDEYRDYVRKVMNLPAEGFTGMNYAEGYYLPMVALVQYLDEHGFTVFISSGSERACVRELIKGKLDTWIPSYRVIGSTYSFAATGQGDEDGRSYTLKTDDQVVLSGDVVVKNQKMNKVTAIINEIGKTPILVFGNSSGDLAMGQYAVNNKTYSGKAYMLLCDDTERDYGKPDTAASFAEKCTELGFETISMKNDFATIYGETVVKTMEEPEAEMETIPLSTYWSADSPVAQSLREYVAKVTNPEDTDNYIPEKDRIAVFDMDGTLICETYYTYYDTMMFIEYCLVDHPEKVSDELKQVAASIKPGYKADEALARNFAKAYAGMTIEEFSDYVTQFGQKETESFHNMRYIDCFYLPMVELVEYLYENGFTIYVSSGTERTTSRAIVVNSPIKDYVMPSHVIGTEFEVKQKGYETEPSNMNFKYENGDELVYTGGFIQKNLNGNKSIYIEKEIGQRPVLAFGNTRSDTSMMNYTIDSRNPYPAQAYMVVADDNVREWGTQDWEEKSKEYTEDGYIPVSMKNDFAQIYPEGITPAEEQYYEHDWSDSSWYEEETQNAA